jgi:hypothetical protein
MESKGMVGLAGRILDRIDAHPSQAQESLDEVCAYLGREIGRMVAQDCPEDEEEALYFNDCLNELKDDLEALEAVKRVLPDAQHGNAIAWCARELLRRSYSLL